MRFNFVFLLVYCMYCIFFFFNFFKAGSIFWLSSLLILFILFCFFLSVFKVVFFLVLYIFVFVVFLSMDKILGGFMFNILVMRFCIMSKCGLFMLSCIEWKSFWIRLGWVSCLLIKYLFFLLIMICSMYKEFLIDEAVMLIIKNGGWD